MRRTLSSTLSFFALVLAVPPAGATDGALSGTLDISIRGSGAAPLGIASAISGTTNFGVGLGRLQTMAEPITVLPANETYGGSATFTLVPASARRWCLEELEITYQLTDSTRLDYEEGLISDSMHDQGSVRWKRSPGRPCKDTEGRWQGPTGWEPEFDPRMVLELFKAPTAAECDDPGVRSLFNQARQILWPTGDWATCYELDVFVMHPIRASGTSSWTSGPVEISLDATDGRLRFAADSGFDLDQAQLPPEVPPEAKEFLKAVRSLQDQWQEGFAEFDADHEMAWERKYTGALPEAEDIRQSMIYAILTGATVVERLSLTHLRFVLEKAPERWRPVPQSHGDEEVEITARVAGPRPRPVRWRLTVAETSKAPGGFMNDDLEHRLKDYDWEDADNPDFEPVRWTDDGYVATTRKPLEEVTLRLRSDDGAAWAKVRAEAEIEPGAWIQAEVEGSDLDYITVPRDEEGGENYIADAWERDQGLEPGLDPTTDDESEPAPAQKGDGLTLWEEYRGFEMEGDWHPTHPQEKDLFIHFTGGTGAAIGDVEDATGLRVHEIWAEEFVSTAERVVNRRQGRFSRGEQHGLWVNEVMGETNCDDNGNGDSEDGGAGEGGGGESRLPCGVGGEAIGGPGRPVVVTEILVRRLAGASTVVHEVMHGVDVPHHGETDDWDREVCEVGTGDDPTVYAEDQTHCEMQAGGKWVERLIAYPHGQHSGDQECPMKYDVAVGYVGLDGVLARRPDGSLEPFKDGPYPGRACTSGDGTHFNADGQQVGGADAGRGGCRRRIAISSWGG